MRSALSGFDDSRQRNPDLHEEPSRRDRDESDAAAQRFDPFAHPAYSEPPSLAEVHLGSSLAIVLDGKDELTRAGRQGDGTTLRLRMLDDVSETFLNDAVECDRQLARHGVEITAGDQFEG